MVVGISVAASWGILACGVDTFGTMEVADTPVASAPANVPSVRPPSDGLSLGGGDEVDAATDAPIEAVTDAAAVCPLGTSRCAATGTCVADCVKGCPAAPVACVACNAGNAVVASECVPAATPAACITLPRVHCACAGGNAALCPGKQQVCAGALCLACGEPGSNGLDCKDPGDKACDSDGKGKAEEELTCH